MRFEVQGARAQLWVLVLVALSCAAKPEKKEKPRPPPEPTDPISRIKRTVAHSYEAVCTLEPEKLEELVSDQVVGYGFGPVDYIQNRNSLIAEARQQLVPFGLHGDTLRVVKSRPRVGLSSDQMSAWVWDLPQIEQERGGDKGTRIWLPRVTMHLVYEFSSWRIDGFHLSFGYPDADLYAPEAERALISPAPLDVNKGPNSDQAVGLARRLIDDITVKVNRVADSDQVLLLGTDPGDVFEGGLAFKNFARPRLAELKKAPFTLKMDGGPVARTTGKTAWVLATVQLTLGKGKDLKRLTPFRAFWVFAENGEMLDLVLEHQSLGLKPEQRKPGTADEVKANKVLNEKALGDTPDAGSDKTEKTDKKAPTNRGNSDAG